MKERIVCYQMPNLSPMQRIERLNEVLHRIFFESKEVCTEDYLDHGTDGSITCRLCDDRAELTKTLKHTTPRFLESLDAMQIIVESGRFAEVREEFFHWLSKERYECTLFLYGQIGSGIIFRKKGNSRQEAFCLAALASHGYTVVTEEQGEDQ